MKKIKLILASLFSLALVLSCNDDGGDSNLNLSSGAVPDIKKVAGTDPIISLLEIQEGNDISISFTTSIAQGKVASADIIGFYFKASDGSYEKVVLANDVTTFPTTVTLTKQNLIDAFTALNGDADFELGDQLKISADLTLTDGRVLGLLKEDGTQNYGPDIANSPLYSVVQIYNVSCPSDLGGTYNVLSSGSSTDTGPTPDENPISDYASTTVITDNGGGNYTMSDSFGGLYLLWYDIYGITADNAPGSFSDVCGTISGSFTDAFGGAVTLTGTVNPDGTLTIHFENEFGDIGDSVYTKQ